MTTNHDGAVSTEAAPSGMRDFIELILGSMEGNAIMAYATGRTERGKLAVASEEWFRYPEEIDRMVEYAERERSGDARNVYLSPLIYGDQTRPFENRRTGEIEDRITRAKSNAIASQTVYMDSDDCPRDAFRLAPSIHVQTSEQHGHDYWLLPEPVSAEEAATAARKISVGHKKDGCDPSGWSMNKLLRMPTVNTSYDPKNPWEITWDTTGEFYEIADIMAAYEDVDLSKAAPAVRSAGVDIAARDAPAIEALPDRMDLLGKIPQENTNLIQLLMKKPKTGDGGWRSEQLWSLLLELFRLRFTAEEAVSLAWGAPTASKWREDGRGIEGMWGDALRAEAVVEQERGGETGEAVMSVSTVLRDAGVSQRLHLISEDERAAIADRWDFLWEYEEWARDRVTVLNEAYHRANAWTILSAVYGDRAYVPKKAGEMPLNLWFISLGESSSGKSEAIGLMKRVLGAVFEESPFIGTNHSENALIEQLLNRDGEVSIMDDDEADGTLAKWRGNADGQRGWSDGVPQTVTRGYDGPVPSLGRVGKKDLRKSSAKTTLVLHLVGTPQGMYRVLDGSMFRTGFLARCIWVLGRDIPVTRESIRTEIVRGERSTEYDVIPTLWAERFTQHRLALQKAAGLGGGQMGVDYSDEALHRIDEAKWAMTQHFGSLGQKDIFTPAVRRMSDILLKACALYALSEGRHVVTVRDVIVTLTYVEDWLDTLKVIAGNIAASAFSMACDEIERLVAGQKGKVILASTIYQKLRAEPRRKVDDYLESLKAQGRLRQDADQHHRVTYAIQMDREEIRHDREDR